MAQGEPPDLDAKVCLCFHVTRRKLINFLRTQRPRVPSQLSQCGGAGTGCGWCVPYLKQLFGKVTAGEAEGEALTPEEYARRRAAYVRAGKGTPPPGATPLPPEGEG
jgi:NAD(P)H-nitrite reductase large subunit